MLLTQRFILLDYDSELVLFKTERVESVVVGSSLNVAWPEVECRREHRAVSRHVFRVGFSMMAVFPAGCQGLLHQQMPHMPAGRLHPSEAEEPILTEFLTPP